MDFLTSWLIRRMQWVYNFIVTDLHLPSFVGYVVILSLIFVFFYSLADIYTQREKGTRALIYLLVVLVLPLGTLVYLFYGMRDLHHAPATEKRVYDFPPEPGAYQAQTADTTQSNQELEQPDTRSLNGKRATSTLGTIIGTIALIFGLVALAFFIFVVIALIQCANDPKCM